jgi:hypothetical protein
LQASTKGARRRTLNASAERKRGEQRTIPPMNKPLAISID